MVPDADIVALSVEAEYRSVLLMAKGEVLGLGRDVFLVQVQGKDERTALRI